MFRTSSRKKWTVAVWLSATSIGHDAPIGRRFLEAGNGFRGGCLPKDIRAFSARAEELARGVSVAFLTEIDAIDMRRRQRMVDMVVEALGGQVYRDRDPVALESHVRTPPIIDGRNVLDPERSRAAGWT